MSPVRRRGARDFSPGQAGPLFYDGISFLQLPRVNHLPKDSGPDLVGGWWANCALSSDDEFEGGDFARGVREAMAVCTNR